MKFELEAYSEKLIEDIKPLLELHYQELTLHKEHIKLDPDWTKYEKLATTGHLTVITARDNGKLVGYSVFFLTNHMHYKQNIMAMNDVLFLHPDYRKGMTGIKLIKESERILLNQNVIKIVWHVKFAKDFRNILYRMGYVDEDAIVGKILKE